MNGNPAIHRAPLPAPLPARFAASLLVLVALGGACGQRAPSVSDHLDAAADTQRGSPALDASDSSQRDTAAGAQDGSSAIDASGASQPPIDGQCPDSLSACGKGDGLRCRDLSRSKNHCGTCGQMCAPGFACQGGTCQQYRCKGALTFKALAFNSMNETLVRDIWPVLGDFDGDGNLDLVGVPEANAPVSLLYGAGNGTFPTGQVIDPSSPSSRRWRAVAADLDEDGFLDSISTASGDSPVKAVTVRRGSGSRSAPFGEPATYPTGGPPFSLLLADVDSDGRLDLVAGVEQALEYWRGQAGGGFAQQTPLASQDSLLPSAFTPPPVATDWNGDGVPDLVYASARNLHFRLGRGEGSFDAEVACALAAGVIGDLDHDNRPDLVSGSNLLLGLDACRANKIIPLLDWPKQGGVALADFNGDGNLDIVADSNTNIIVRVGDGQGGFAQSLSMPAHTDGQWPIGIFLIGDLNRDSKLDFVFTRSDGWGVFLNTCP